VKILGICGLPREGCFSFQELAVKIKNGDLPISQLYLPNPLLKAC
jgi:hypothetical protein